MNAFYFVAAVVAVIAVTHVNARANGILEEHPIDWYDCGGKRDGNYEHPTDCTRFISCSGGIASQRDCANCHVDPVRCPQGRTVYNASVDACLWADETQCGNGNGGVNPSSEPTQEPITTPRQTTPPNNNSPTTTTEEPEPTTPKQPENPELPNEGDACDPHFCKNNGTCQHYFRCDKNSSTVVREECGGDLLWNPLASDGSEHPHGGNCDTWENLKQSTKDKYRNDPECLACFWKETGECRREYQYQPPLQTHKNVLNLTCSEGLVFVLAKETCVRCEDAVNSDGEPCC